MANTVNSQKLGRLANRVSGAEPGTDTKRGSGPDTETPGPLDRYIAVLEIIAALPGAATLTDVCELLHLPKATGHRLLAGLVRANLIEGGGRFRAYRLGSRLVRLAHSSAADGWVAALAKDPLQRLAAERNETCYLTRLVGHRVFVVARESPEASWRHYVQPGYTMPPHAAAAAKAILAFQDEAVIAQALSAEPLPKLTSSTVVEHDAILEEYEAVRTKGYATCVSEIDEGFGALAVPIRQVGGEILHSVGITGPVGRIMDAAIAKRLESLRTAAASLSHVLSLGSDIVGRAGRS